MANLICLYDVTSTTESTRICFSTNSFSDILIDGTSIGLVKGYTFTSTGINTVEFVLRDETTIGNYAFSLCKSLYSIVIPDTVTTIGDEAFDGCEGLKSVDFPDSLTTIGDWAFSSCELLNLITIPDTVTTIGQSAFRNCRSLTLLTIPDSVTTIGDGAFEYCKSLTSIVVDSYNTTYDSREGCNCIIENHTNKLIRGCNNSFIPDSVTSIGDSAFDGCEGLTSITIPDSVTTIGDKAFYGCEGLTSITVEATTAPVVESETFKYIKTGGTLYYPEGSDYSTWLSTNAYYLGYYSWNGVEVEVGENISSIELEYDSITFDSYAISTSIDVVYNEIETINEPLVYGSWISLTTMATVSETNRYYFSLERNEGSDRQGTITFSGTDTDGNLITKILTITQTNYEEQMATSITIKKTSIEFPYEGSTDSVQVVYTNPNEILEPQPSQSFIAVTQTMTGSATSGTDILYTVHYDITMGETSIARNGTITFRCTDSAGNEITNSHLTCYQSAPSTASITFSPTSLTFPYTGGTSFFYARVTNPTEDGIGLETTSDYLVNFSSTLNYEDDDYIEYKVVVEADVNNTTTKLTEMLKVSYTDTNGDYLEVEYPIIIGYQGEGVCKAFVTKMDVYADGTPVNASNSVLTVGYSGVTINTPVVNGDWITLGEGTVNTGVFYGYDTVMEYPVTFAANEGGVRIGTITFSGVDGLNNEKSDVLTITQEAYEGGGEEEPDTPDIPEDSTDVYYGAIWQDVEYSFGGSENVTYTISTDVFKWFPNVGTYKEEEVIYKGVAWKSPDREGLSININKICQNYFDAQYLPLGTAVGISQNYKVFYLRGEMGELLRTYHFINDWSYETMKMGLKTNPIIPQIVEGQYCFFSTLALGEMDVPWGMDYYDGTESYKNTEMLQDTFKTVIIANSRRQGISRFWFGSRYYDYVPKCKSHYVLYYSNPYGGWDWFPIMGKVTRTDSMTSYTYTQNYNNTKLDFGTAKYLNEIRIKYRLNTGWLKQSQSDRMWELLESNNVYLHNTETDEIYPVVITNTDVEFKRRTPTNKVINYDIDIELSQMRERL